MCCLKTGSFSHCDCHTNPTADCGTLPPPINGFLLQLDTNTKEGSEVVFQCDPGFVPEGEMTAVCGSDGQWTPNLGGVTCSPRPTPTFTQTFTEASIVTPSATPDFTTPGESKFLQFTFIRSVANIYELLLWYFNCNLIFLIFFLPVITFLQDPVMKEAISLPCVPPVLPLQQLSPVLCHSSLEHWLVLWCTTVL